MSKFPQDKDERLVAFLQQNRPTPPQEPLNFEDKLMDLIEQEVNYTSSSTSSCPPSTNPHYYWAFPGVIAASLLFVWSSLRTLIPPQTARAEIVEIESFLIKNWHGVIGEVDSQQVNYNYPEGNSWLLLPNLTTESHPLPQVYNVPTNSHVPQPQLHNIQYQTR